MALIKQDTTRQNTAMKSAGAKPFFFLPRQEDISSMDADNQTDRSKVTPAENYFFKPDKSPGNFIQRIPAPGSTTSTPTAQPAANQTKTPSPSHRQIPQGAISRADFDQYVKTYYGVQEVHTGTQQEQESTLTGQNSKLPTIPGWARWDPDVSPEQYTLIIKAIEDAAATFGAIPNIQKIIFYQMNYKTNAASIGVAQPNDGATFGGGVLTIYKAFTGNHGFPVGQSNAQGNYPPVGFQIGPSGGTSGAPTPFVSQDQNLKENIVHELGHGIAEAAHAADPNALDNFNTTVGWFGSTLYDIGQPAVQTAMANKTAPPAQFKIEPSNWNDPKWKEQPMTAYSTANIPGEDFAESIAAFVYAKASLQARSPRRFNFIQNGIETWKTKMRAMPPPASPEQKGDFPVNEQIKHTA